MGDYRIVRLLGEGGMGVVYEAEQQHPRRPVALKVIRGGQHLDSQRVKLFQREAQALGRLKHPGIAAIYEAGCTEDGRHFFAMELARGVPLSEWLRQAGKDGPSSAPELRKRLRLFIGICDAVGYAHQRGVIHRDLKPANVLVMGGARATVSGAEEGSLPEIKILDFGLARITDADVALSSVVTELGLIQGTLPYMSPEQTRGNPDEIDLRSDVYSLGVVLYELTTGELPYPVQNTTPLEAIRIINQEPPRPPSQVRTLHRERPKGLDRDLQTVILKALEKDPARRYQSVFALTDDLERYLGNQPILARPPTALYQLRKLVSRHRTGFAFAAALLALLAAFAVAMAVQAERIARERDRAEKEAARAGATSAFLQEALGSANPVEGRGRDTTVLEVLDGAAARAGEAFPEQPETEAAVRETIGLTYYRLGRYEEAERQLRTALQIRRRRGGEGVEALGTLVNLAVAVHDRGRLREAESLYREAMETAGRLPGVSPEDSTAIANNLALLLFDQGSLEEAESLFREVVRRDRESATRAGPDLAVDLNNLGLVLQERGRLGEAEALLREGLAILREHRHPYAAVSQGNLADVVCARGEFAEADRMFSEAVSTGRGRLGETHADVAKIEGKHGQCLMRNGQRARAEEVLLAAHRTLASILGDRHPRTRKVAGHLVELYESGGQSGKAAPYRTPLEPPP